MSPYQPVRLHTRRFGPLMDGGRWRDLKDPCPVFDGERWHLYGSAGSVVEEKWLIIHTVAPAPHGPWNEPRIVTLHGLDGDHVAAPGVVWENGRFHMFVQTQFMALGGTIEYLTSSDGEEFFHENTALTSVANTQEAGIYDPHPARVAGRPTVVYAGMREVGRGDIYVTRSATDSWVGPWERERCILHHGEVPHHNQLDHLDYEWGLEGPQLIELEPQLFLLTAVSFLPTGERGTRQRVFFALAKNILGPYESLGPLLDPEEPWESGENGHATSIIIGDSVMLFYQARGRDDRNHWRYGLAIYSIEDLKSAAARIG